MPTGHEAQYVVEWLNKGDTEYRRFLGTKAECYEARKRIIQGPGCTYCAWHPVDPPTTNAPKARPLTATIAAVALALTLASPAHAAPPTFELPVHPPDTYLAGCAIMVHDDGTRLATCDEDGAVLVFDVDGNRFINEAGAPIRAAGWFVLE